MSTVRALRAAVNVARAGGDGEAASDALGREARDRDALEGAVRLVDGELRRAPADPVLTAAREFLTNALATADGAAHVRHDEPLWWI